MSIKDLNLNLYLVQDSDRPMYIVAPDWHAALTRWEKQIRAENEDDMSCLAPLTTTTLDADYYVTPQGVQFICGARDLLLPEDITRLIAKLAPKRAPEVR